MDKRIPNGCQEWYFNDKGDYLNRSPGKAFGGNKFKLVFHCIAINKRNAFKKFEKWKKFQKQESIIVI
jgi:hypothetical protein